MRIFLYARPLRGSTKYALALALSLLVLAGSAWSQERLSIDELLGGPKEPAQPTAEPAPPLPELPAAQIPEPKPEVQPEPAAAAKPATPLYSGETIAGRQGGAIEESWHRLHEALRRRQYSVVTAELETLEKIRQRMGVETLPDVSNALLELAAQARRDADTEMAGRLIDAAETLTPNHVGAAFARAELAGGNRAGFIRQWLAGYGRALDWLPARLALKGYALLTAGLVLGAAGLLLALALFYRHISPMAHDLGHLLRLSRSAVAGPRLALLMLLLTPLAFGWGALALAPVWIACFFSYASVRERALAPLVLLGLAATPLLLHEADQQLIRSRAPALVSNLRARQERYSPELHAALANRVRKHPGEWLSRFSLAYILTKGGLGEPARHQWEQIIQGAPGQWKAYNNKAVSWVYDGDPGQAEGELRRSLQVAPNQAALQFNLSRVLLARGAAAEAQEAVRQARSLDPVATGLWERSGTGGALEASMQLSALSEAEIVGALELLASDETGASLTEALGISFWPGPVGLALLALLAIGVLALLRGRLRFSSSCERCGTAISAHGAEAAQSRTICPQCVAAFYRKQVGESESRVRKVAQVERYQRRRRWLLRLLSLILPGAAQLGGGRAELGVALALPALALALAAGLVSYFPPGPPAADPYLITQAATWPWTALAAPLLGLLYLAGIIQNLMSEK